LTKEYEYMETTHAIKEEFWLCRLCSGIGFKPQDMRINYDIQSFIFLENNSTYHSRMKNIDVQYHFMRDMVEKKKVLWEKVGTLKNITESLTKSVSVVKLFWCREEMGIVSMGQ
jgi:hypothetical protein